MSLPLADRVTATIQSLEPTATLELFELNFGNLGLTSPKTVPNLTIDVGTSSTGADYIAAADSPTEIRLNLGTISAIITPTSAGGTITKLYSDTILYTPPAGYNSIDTFSIIIDESILYFHNGTNELKEDVIWQTNRYSAFPIQAEGFEYTGSGQLPRPTMRIANVYSTISAYLVNFEDLVGAKVTRRRTYTKYLDAANFIGGVNGTADPTSELTTDVYRIDRKVTESPLIVEFELAAVWDIEGIQIPRRVIVQNLCSWIYKGTECGYVVPLNGPYYDKSNIITTDVNSDRCSKQLAGCALRFDPNTGLPFGGFPGAGITR